MPTYPLTLDTVAKFHAAHHRLAVHCPGCFRWSELDLAAMIKRGEGDRRFANMKPRCTVCGGPGKWQVRPPTGPT